MRVARCEVEARVRVLEGESIKAIALDSEDYSDVQVMSVVHQVSRNLSSFILF